MTLVSVIAPTPAVDGRAGDTSSPTSILASESLEGLHRSGHVALEDQVEAPGSPPLSHGRHEVLESTTQRGRWGLGNGPHVLARLAASRRFWRAIRSSLDDQEVLTRTRHGRPGRAPSPAVPGRPRPSARAFSSSSARTRPWAGSGDDGVTDPERAALDQGPVATGAATNGRGEPRRPAPVRPGWGWPLRSQRRVGGQHDRLEQLVEVELGLGRDVDEHRVAAVTPQAPRPGTR